MMPGVDDGPADKKKALEMIEASYIDGIRHIVLTSHLNHPLGFSGEDDYDEIFCDFKKLVEEGYPDLKIYSAAEVYISRKMLSEMDKLKIRTINNLQYVLVEFSRNIKFHEMDRAVHELKMMGYRTIIAHVEQYHFVRDKYNDILQLKADGAVIQSNSDGFKKNARYTNIVKELMKRNIVDLVASDCHNMDDRAPGLKNTYNAIVRKHGKKIADRIFFENPERIIKGQELPVFLEGKTKQSTGRTLKVKLAVIAMVTTCAVVLFMSRVISLKTDIEMKVVEEVNVTVDIFTDISENLENEFSVIEEGKDDFFVNETTDTQINSGNSSEELVEDSNNEITDENTQEIVGKSHEEILVGSYVSYLEDLESEYMETCEYYYSILKSAIDIEDKTERNEKIEEILDELGSVETSSDNQVYKVLYDMQNDLEEYKYDVAIVQELREHYIEVKLEVSEGYKIHLEEYGNDNYL